MNLVKSEFDCPCCGENKLTEETFNRFLLAREYAKTPFVITSGYRCKKYNADPDVGSSETSSHPKGMAGDIACNNSWARWKIVFALKEAGFVRIRIAKTFIHADTDRSKAQATLGLY